MNSLQQRVSLLLIVSVLLYFPGVVAYAEKGAVNKRGTYTYATPGEAEGDGQFVHGAKPGVLLIRVHVLGAVAQQGIHYFPENINLLDAMLYVGGLQESTDLNGIEIRRKGKKDIISVDLEEIIEDGTEIPTLADGDVMKIPWNWRRDISTIGLITSFLTSMTAFTLSLITLVK